MAVTGSITYAGTPQTIPFSELGAKATADCKGDAIGITSTAEGATLRTGFQKLAGTVTREGLRLESTEVEGGSLQLTASAVGRVGGAVQVLSTTGSVTSTTTLVTFTRPGLSEEYSVSADGVRQDFIVPTAPAGDGELSVELALSGATAEAAAEGAKLTLAGSGRELAYSRLHVTDANGKALAAALAVLSPTRLAVQVDDAGAVYPVRIDPTFSDADWISLNPGIPGANGQVNAAAVDGSGNLYIGGDFTAVGTIAANRIAKWDGSAWSALGSGMNNNVYALAVSGSNLYAGGSFTGAGGMVANRIAKWDGSIWSALGTGMDGGDDTSVYALAVRGSDLYAGGSFTTAGGVSANYIAKWNGSAWSALGTGMDYSVSALAVSGSDLYAGGYFTIAGGVSANNIAKWNGSAWSALGSGMGGVVYASVYALAVSGSDLYAGGWFTTAGGTSANRIAKWNGSAWSALGAGMGGGEFASVYALAVSGSDLYAGGDFSTAGGTSANGIAKWNGSAWSALGTGMNGPVFALAVSGSDLYAGGWFTTTANRIAKWNGSAWSALGSGMSGVVGALAVSGSDLYAGGWFTTAGGTSANYIAKWNGSAWSALGTGMNGVVGALAVSGSDLYAGGYFTIAGGVSANNIAKWNGSAWSALGSGMNRDVYSLAVSGSDLYAGGDFTTAGGKTANRIAKWNGSAWSALGSGMGGYVRALAVSGSDLYAGGEFTAAGGKTVDYIAKWNGSAWSALGGGMSAPVYALAMSGSDLYAGGPFGTAGGTTADFIAKWNGSAWSALGSGMNNTVVALAVSGSDLYAGGVFTTAGGTSANRIAKWNGSTWSALGSGMNNTVVAIEAVGTTRLYVGGQFDFAGTTVSPFIAQANLAPTVTASSANLLSKATSLTIFGTGFDALTPGANSVVFTPAGSGTVTAATETSLTVTSLSGLSVGALNAVVATHGLNSGAAVQVATVIAPAFAVTGNNVVILDGDSTPSSDDLTDFGAVPLLNQQVTRHFIMPNLGVSPLNLTGTPKVQITGAAAADFKVTAEPSSSVAVGGSSSFDITFDPTLPGLRSATVNIANDSATPAFTFAISGYGRLTTLLAQTITFSPPTTVYMGQTAPVLTAYASSGLPVTLSVASGPATFWGNFFLVSGAGTVKVVATQPGGGNYKAAVAVTRTILVKTDPTVLTLINLNQTYDGTAKAVETLGAAEPSIFYKVGTTHQLNPPIGAGSYTVTAEAGAVTKTGTLVIAKAPLFVTPGDQRKFAGQPNPAMPLPVITGFQNGETAAVLTKAPVLKTTATTASVGGLYPITASGGEASNYTFIYRQGTLVVESFAGNYEALLVDATPSLPVGKLSLTVAASSKTFTGKLFTSTETAALSLLSTALTTNPSSELATGSVTVTKAGVPYVVDITLPLQGDVLATVTRSGFPLCSANDGRKLNMQTITFGGAHTAVLEPALPASSTVPAGAGWATASISTKGVLMLAGKLGDGTAFTTALTPDVDSDPGYRLFMQPYKTGAVTRTESLVGGAFTLATHPALTNRRYLEQAALTWKKTGVSTDTTYRTSFGPVSTVLMIDPWQKPVSATKTVAAITLAQRLGLTGSSFGIGHSDTLSLSQGNLPTRASLSATNAVSVTTPSTNLTKWKMLTVNATTGTFTGSFELDDNGQKRPVTFSGVLRQPATAPDTLIGDGHYVLPPLTGTEKTTGEVRLTRP